MTIVFLFYGSIVMVILFSRNSTSEFFFRNCFANTRFNHISRSITEHRNIVRDGILLCPGFTVKTNVQIEKNPENGWSSFTWDDTESTVGMRCEGVNGMTYPGIVFSRLWMGKKKLVIPLQLNMLRVDDLFGDHRRVVYKNVFHIYTNNFC